MMPDSLPDPFLPVDAGAIALASMYAGLRRAGLDMVEAAVLVGAQTAMMAVITEAARQPPRQD